MCKFTGDQAYVRCKYLSGLTIVYVLGGDRKVVNPISLCVVISHRVCRLSALQILTQVGFAMRKIEDGETQDTQWISANMLPKVVEVKVLPSVHT